MGTKSVDIGTTIAHGVMFDPKNNDQVQSMDLNRLRSSAEQLFDLLDQREIEYVLVGGVAMLAYVEGRNTQDVDLIVSHSALAKLPEMKVEEENKQFARAWFDDLRVDFLFTDNKLFKLVASKYVSQHNFAGRSVPCATELGLIALKLYSLPSLYRQGQFEKVDVYRADITALLRRTRLNTIPIIEILRPHLLDSDVAELEKIVASIIQHIEREGDAFRQ